MVGTTNKVLGFGVNTMTGVLTRQAFPVTLGNVSAASSSEVKASDISAADLSSHLKVYSSLSDLKQAFTGSVNATIPQPEISLGIDVSVVHQQTVNDIYCVYTLSSTVATTQVTGEVKLSEAAEKLLADGTLEDIAAVMGDGYVSSVTTGVGATVIIQVHLDSTDDRRTIAGKLESARVGAKAEYSLINVLRGKRCTVYKHIVGINDAAQVLIPSDEEDVGKILAEVKTNAESIKPVQVAWDYQPYSAAATSVAARKKALQLESLASVARNLHKMVAKCRLAITKDLYALYAADGWQRDDSWFLDRPDQRDMLILKLKAMNDVLESIAREIARNFVDEKALRDYAEQIKYLNRELKQIGLGFPSRTLIPASELVSGDEIIRKNHKHGEYEFDINAPYEAVTHQVNIKSNEERVRIALGVAIDFSDKAREAAYNALVSANSCLTGDHMGRYQATFSLMTKMAESFAERARLAFNKACEMFPDRANLNSYHAIDEAVRAAETSANTAHNVSDYIGKITLMKKLGRALPLDEIDRDLRAILPASVFPAAVAFPANAHQQKALAIMQPPPAGGGIPGIAAHVDQARVLTDLNALYNAVNVEVTAIVGAQTNMTTAARDVLAATPAQPISCLVALDTLLGLAERPKDRAPESVIAELSSARMVVLSSADQSASAIEQALAKVIQEISKVNSLKRHNNAAVIRDMLSEIRENYALTARNAIDPRLTTLAGYLNMSDDLLRTQQQVHVVNQHTITAALIDTATEQFDNARKFLRRKIDNNDALITVVVAAQTDALAAINAVPVGTVIAVSNITAAQKNAAVQAMRATNDLDKAVNNMDNLAEELGRIQAGNTAGARGAVAPIDTALATVTAQLAIIREAWTEQNTADNEIINAFKHPVITGATAYLTSPAPPPPVAGTATQSIAQGQEALDALYPAANQTAPNDIRLRLKQHRYGIDKKALNPGRYAGKPTFTKKIRVKGGLTDGKQFPVGETLSDVYLKPKRLHSDRGTLYAVGFWGVCDIKRPKVELPREDELAQAIDAAETIQQRNR